MWSLGWYLPSVRALSRTEEPCLTLKNNERQQIGAKLEMLFLHQPPNTSNQFGRVVAVTAGANWYTLRQLEARIFARFPAHRDSQAAISARLREVSPANCGLVKEVRIIRTPDKNVYQYRLVPAPPDMPEAS